MLLKNPNFSFNDKDFLKINFVLYRSMLTTSDFAMSINTFLSGLSRYFPPQFRERDKSFPVPKGMIPMAGRRPLGKDDFIESITDKIQPTVPSPPQAEILK